MGLSIKWDITYNCNLFCSHCLNGNYLSKDTNEIDVSSFKMIVTEINNYINIDYIHFLGGEPLFKKDFLEMTEVLAELEIPFGFNTNSLLINTTTVSRLFQNPFLRDVTLSLDGSNKETNDAIRGKAVFNSVTRALHCIADYKAQHSDCQAYAAVNTVLTKLNYFQISEMIEFCNKMHVTSLKFLEFIEDGNAKGKDLALTDEDFLSAVISVAEQYTSRESSLTINPSFARPLAKDFVQKCLNLDFPDVTHYCGAGVTLAFLDNKGNLFPCDRERNFRNDCGKSNVLQEGFAKLWESKKFDEPFSKYASSETYSSFSPCAKCKYQRESCFPCYLCLERAHTNTMRHCALFEKEALRKGVDLFED